MAYQPWKYQRGYLDPHFFQIDGVFQKSLIIIVASIFHVLMPKPLLRVDSSLTKVMEENTEALSKILL